MLVVIIAIIAMAESELSPKFAPFFGMVCGLDCLVHRGLGRRKLTYLLFYEQAGIASAVSQFIC